MKKFSKITAALFLATTSVSMAQPASQQRQPREENAPSSINQPISQGQERRNDRRERREDRMERRNDRMERRDERMERRDERMERRENKNQSEDKIDEQNVESGNQDSRRAQESADFIKGKPQKKNQNLEERRQKIDGGLDKSKQ